MIRILSMTRLCPDDVSYDAPSPDVSYSSTNEKLPADTHTYLSIFVSTNTNIHTLFYHAYSSLYVILRPVSYAGYS